jgi:hypothetical protein
MMLTNRCCCNSPRDVVIDLHCGAHDSRDDRKHGKEPIPNWKTLDWITEATHLLATPSRPTSTGLQQQKIKWTPAPSGKIKVNVDASFVKENCTGAIGAIACNSDGSFLWAAGSWLPSVVGSALVGEAETVRVYWCSHASKQINDLGHCGDRVQAAREPMAI